MESWCTSKNTLSDVDNTSIQNQNSDATNERFEQIFYDLKSYKKLSESDLKFVENLNHSEKNNCELFVKEDWDDYLIYNIVTTQKIKKNSEILLNYEN